MNDETEFRTEHSDLHDGGQPCPIYESGQTPYHYFVSFAHGDGLRGGGFGHMELFRSKPIRSGADVVSVQQFIEGQGAVNVAIINFQRFESDTSDMGGQSEQTSVEQA